ncbi:glycosyltransferase WbuB [Paenibacillus selenitireducens]|uniref:Glycosyltransferase WbuB n=1 Tax=Paenibacillus selenitireducens TaxID=1324314 RepID=A0A1T2XKT1_9BACL|nr:glycosyltransferase family 4 protein [Paenibacillus selenitireducens]OPA80474.1 glycosyltransferase WbuB [Paenibacillus selenitireducens]
MTKKKIVFVINSFYPDFASTGQLLTELCLDLQQDFEITVIASQPEFSQDQGSQRLFECDELEDIKIIRLRLPKVDKTSKVSRLINIGLYFTLALIALLREKKVNIIYTISQPPILGGFIGSIGKFLKRSKHVYNIQDFNPEQAEAVSYMDKQFIFNMARKVDNLNCRYSDHVILVGHDMAETLKNRFTGRTIPQHSVINNWTDEKDIVPLDKAEKHVASFIEEYQLENKFIIMYSGNIGLYYDLENIIKVTKHFKDNQDIVFIFVGDGAVKKEMQSYVNEQNIKNVLFIPFQLKEFIKYSLNAADVHLVVNQKGIKGVSVPSKIYGVMAAGKAILGVLEQGSEAQILIEASHCGVVVEPQDYDGIIDAINQLFAFSEDQREQLGANGRIYLDKHLKREDSIAKYRELLLQL